MLNNWKPISPIGPKIANGGATTLSTPNSVTTPNAAPTSAQLSQLQTRVDTLEARLIALEGTVHHQQVLIGVLQQAVYKRQSSPV